MYQIQKITSDPYQKQQFVLPDGSAFTMTLRFVPLQFGWFIESLTYGEFTLEGFRICNLPNMLNQWRNKLPFGLACFSTADREPSLQEDFSSGNSVLYVLTQEETQQYAEFISGN